MHLKQFSIPTHILTAIFSRNKCWLADWVGVRDYSDVAMSLHLAQFLSLGVAVGCDWHIAVDLTNTVLERSHVQMLPEITYERFHLTNDVLAVIEYNVQYSVETRNDETRVFLMDCAFVWSTSYYMHGAANWFTNDIIIVFV